MSDPRDTQFAQFTALLFDELLATGCVHVDDCDGEFPESWQKVIAQRAYDLVQHTIGHSLEYLHECGLRTPGSMGLSIQPSIPDMSTLPEVKEPTEL